MCDKHFPKFNLFKPYKYKQYLPLFYNFLTKVRVSKTTMTRYADKQAFIVYRIQNPDDQQPPGFMITPEFDIQQTQHPVSDRAVTKRNLAGKNTCQTLQYLFFYTLHCETLSIFFETEEIYAHSQVAQINDFFIASNILDKNYLSY